MQIFYAEWLRFTDQIIVFSLSSIVILYIYMFCNLSNGFDFPYTHPTIYDILKPYCIQEDEHNETNAGLSGI